MAELLKGADVAQALDERTRAVVQELKEKNIGPKLVLIRVGSKEADLSYERNICKRCEKTGILVEKKIFEETVTTSELVELIRSLNADRTVHGVLFFMPFPKKAGIDERAVREALIPAKDVDGCTALSQSGVFTDSGEGFAPCTARAAMEVLAFYGISVAGKHAVVVGRSLVVGKPLAMLLLKENATVTVCHSRTENLAELTSKADILLCAVGRPEFLDAGYLGNGQVIVDAGINWNEEKQKICGDVSGEEAERKARAYTPVPGGVGGVTTSVLALHTAEAAMRMADC